MTTFKVIPEDSVDPNGETTDTIELVYDPQPPFPSTAQIRLNRETGKHEIKFEGGEWREAIITEGNGPETA